MEKENCIKNEIQPLDIKYILLMYLNLLSHHLITNIKLTSPQKTKLN